MAQYDRDKDDVRVFDGGEDDDDTEGSHLPVVIIIAILVLAAFGGVVWLAYNQGVARGRGDVPVRVAANETGGTGQGQIKVFQQPAGAEDESAPAPTATAPAQPAAPATPKPEIRPTQTAAAASETPPAALTPVKPQPAPPPPAVATKPPAQLGLAHPVQAQPAQPQPAETETAATPAAATPPKPVAAAAGGYVLQIGAYKSQDDAMAAWKTYQAKHATLLAGFNADVQRADLGDKGVWYRLRVAPFADKSAAAALCERLKAENGACFLAR